MEPRKLSLKRIAASHSSRMAWLPGKCVLAPSDLADTPLGSAGMVQYDVMGLGFAFMIHTATSEVDKAIGKAMFDRRGNRP